MSDDPPRPKFSEQPIQMPAGWIIGWNTFWDMEVPADGFSGSSLLYCLRHDRRLIIDVEWRPEFDPAGHYHFYAERHFPTRADGLPTEVVDSGESRSRTEVAAWVGRWLARGIRETPFDVELPEAGFSPAPESLLPLHLPSGWIIHRNALTASELLPDSLPAGALLFRAIHEQRGFRADVTWQEDHGCQLEILHAPPRSRRAKDPVIPPIFDAASEVAHRSQFTTLDRLVPHLEHWLHHASWWAMTKR